MTQPVQEPSTDRTVGGLDWRTRQLARRPPVVSPGTIIDWAVANGPSDAIIANNTFHNIVYDSVDIPSNSEHFQVGVAGALKPIDIILSGWYMLQLEAWPDTDIGDFTLGITAAGSGFPYWSYSAGSLFARVSTSITAGSNSLEMPTVATFGPVFMQPLGDTVRIGGGVYHALVTPASLDWNFGMLTVVALGAGLDLPTEGEWTPSGFEGDEQFRTYF